MALHRQQTQDGAWCFELRPNRSRSWSETKRFYAVITAVSGLIAALFAWHGLWLVAPFSGLEVLALGAGLYCCSRATYVREVIVVREGRVTVLRGHRELKFRGEFAQAWLQLRWHADGGCGRSCLQLGSHGQYFEIGAFLVEAERRQLAGDLGRLLGQPRGAGWPALAVDAGLNREMGL